MKKFLVNFIAISTFALTVSLSGCKRYEPAAYNEDYEEEETTKIEPITVAETETVAEETVSVPVDSRNAVRVKGIYLGAKTLNNPEFMAEVYKQLDETELNAVVIDIKDDNGRVTCDMDIPVVDELGAENGDIPDILNVMQELKKRDIYCIARIVALKDPFIAEKKPEWSLHKADGSLFRDNKGDAWVNPYKQEYWDYLLDISKEAIELGFDEIQFDYIRFCTERGIDEVVYDEQDTLGRDKISIITELVSYLSDSLRKEGTFVSCDVFGTIIGSPIDARSVGQSYNQMVEAIDYICPMIYPSHYSTGNFGLEHPDKDPYACILGALKLSRKELQKTAEDGVNQAIVRPWLQSFTASYLGEGNYMVYDGKAVRDQIRAVYDSGYDEWILWSASANYFYDGLLSDREALEEDQEIAKKREAQKLEEEKKTDELSDELKQALEGDELSESDQEILLQDGPIVVYEESETVQ
ncbi:MAG: putative glycoside hydrolase [Eubacteriales bacterium]|nr:putative glycoside hydrolase [Eubacteriales bacterium]